MAAAENVPPGSNKFKARYMIDDLRRNAEYFGVQALKPPPEFPSNSINVQRILTVLHRDHPNKLVDVSLAFWKGYWQNQKPMNDDLIRQVLEPHFSNPNEIIEKSQQLEIKKALIDATNTATKSGAFGAPWILVEKDGKLEKFFGSDKLEAIAKFAGLPYHGPNPTEIKSKI